MRSIAQANPRPRNLPAASDAARRAGKPSRSIIRTASSTLVSKSPLSQVKVDDVPYGMAVGGMRRLNSIESKPISRDASSTRRSTMMAASGRRVPR